MIMNKEKFNENLIDFIKNSTCAFTCIKKIKEKLDEKGYIIDEKAKKRIERLLKRIRFEYTEGDETLNIQCSIGAAIVDKDCKETDALYKKADRNLYEAKNYGKNMFIIS